jgi:uncharacterized coiled-coil protein SlyX
MPPSGKNVKSNTFFDEESLQITGPMHVMQAIMVHEQRLNKIDVKIAQQQVSAMQAFVMPSVGVSEQSQACLPQACLPQACDDELYERLSALDEKIQMLEEVIMNLQLTLTNVQSFAMESSLAMMKLQNQINASAPATLAPAPAPAPTVVAPATLAPATLAPATLAPATLAPTVVAPTLPDAVTLDVTDLGSI